MGVQRLLRKKWKCAQSRCFCDPVKGLEPDLVKNYLSFSYYYKFRYHDELIIIIPSEISSAVFKTEEEYRQTWIEQSSENLVLWRDVIS